MKRLSHRERGVYSSVLGTLGFITDWAGYDRFNVDLFVPEAFADVWWHLPLWVVGMFVVITVFSGSDDEERRGLGL